MIVRCPKCKAELDASTCVPGDKLQCTCGNTVMAPKTGGTRWIPPPLAVLLAVVIAVLAIPVLRPFLTYGLRSKASEATINLTAIARAELDYYQKNGQLLAAGPVPPRVPVVQKQAFGADEAFGKLGWQPEGFVYHQYEVRVTSPKSALLIARGDIDGNGKVAEYHLELTVGTPVGQVHNLTPGEY